MDNDKHTEVQQSEVPEQQPKAEAGAKHVNVWRLLAVLGIILAIIAWGLYVLSAAECAAGTAVAALVSCSLGVKSGRGCMRDISITGIIAAVVLIVVFSLFYWGVPYAIDSL